MIYVCECAPASVCVQSVRYVWVFVSGTHLNAVWLPRNSFVWSLKCEPRLSPPVWLVPLRKGAAKKIKSKWKNKEKITKNCWRSRNILNWVSWRKPKEALAKTKPTGCRVTWTTVLSAQYPLLSALFYSHSLLATASCISACCCCCHRIMSAMLAHKRPQAQSEKLNTFVVRRPSESVGDGQQTRPWKVLRLVLKTQKCVPMLEKNTQVELLANVNYFVK